MPHQMRPSPDMHAYRTRALQQAVIIMRDTARCSLRKYRGAVRKDLRLQLICRVNCLSYRN